MDEADYAPSVSMSEEDTPTSEPELDDEVGLPKPKWTCPSCNEQYFDHHNWLMHVEDAHGPKHNCPVHNCYYRTAHKWYMKRHIRETHGPKAIRCSIEGCRGFFVKRCLKRHMLTAHKDKEKDTVAALKDVMNECEHCSFKSPKAKLFEAHMKDFHISGLTCPMTECISRNFFADQVDKHFKNLHAGIRYQYKLGRKLKVFENVSNEVIGSDLTGSRTLSVTESGTEKEEEPLEVVAESTASSFKGFACEKCQKFFRTRRYLTKHIGAVHEKRYNIVPRKKKYPCTVENCEKSFTTPGLLKDHLNWHNGNFEYKCHQCGDEFFARNRFAVHLKKYHLLSISEVIPLAPVEAPETTVVHEATVV
ncbi:hypothetical protein FO519_005212 [Halicephalobus sp. NKZ332]|nr:hypothetical protein FO519_005212 [Halicephalobus sp. NKZ332]